MKRYAAYYLCQDYTSSSCAAEFQIVGSADCIRLTWKIKLGERAVEKNLYIKKIVKTTFKKIKQKFFFTLSNSPGSNNLGAQLSAHNRLVH